MTDVQRIKGLASSLWPVVTGVPLIRIGGGQDGGYLVPDDLDGIRACFSPGVDVTASFESDLLSAHDIVSHQADFSVGGPPAGFVPASFTKKFLGAYCDDVHITLDQWMRNSVDLSEPGDYLLQMDIEGGEYATLLACPDEILNRFRIIVIEIHEVMSWSNIGFLNLVEAFFKRLLARFHVVHDHPNNCCGLAQFGDIQIPRVFELTLLRKDRAQALGYETTFPHPLDRRCVPTRPDLVLPPDCHSPRFDLTISPKIQERVSDAPRPASPMATAPKNKMVLVTCVSHRPPVFAPNLPFKLVVPEDVGAADQLIAPDDWRGDRFHGRILAEYAQLFYLAEQLSQGYGDITHLYIFQYRKFVSEKLGGTVATNMSYARTVSAQQAGELVSSIEFLLQPEIDFMISPILDLQQSVAAQYAAHHQAEDFSAFVLALRKHKFFDDGECCKFINCASLIPAPSLGLVPILHFLETMRVLAEVWELFSSHFLVERSGYQRRVGGFLLERLHSYLLLQSLPDDDSAACGQQYVVSDSSIVRPTI